MSIKFIEKEKQIPFFRGVIFGDAGSGKSFLAKDFAIKSCEATDIKRFILIDTENGWQWLKDEIPEDIQILEPQNFQYTADNNVNAENLPCAIELFSALKSEAEKNPVACIVIDSASHIGKMLYYNTLKEVNAYKERSAKKYKKTFYKQDELQFQDWNAFGEKHDIMINLLKSMNCNVLLCGRATSEKATSESAVEGFAVVDATERTVLDWKKITYEFDFSCLVKPEIDLTNKNSFKKFKTFVLKSRFADDGKILDNNDFLARWFKFFKKMDFEKIKENLLEATQENFESVRKLASTFKLQMNQKQTHELANIIKAKLESFK